VLLCRVLSVAAQRRLTSARGSGPGDQILDGNNPDLMAAASRRDVSSVDGDDPPVIEAFAGRKLGIGSLHLVALSRLDRRSLVGYISIKSRQTELI
jgi:hypothetical protein